MSGSEMNQMITGEQALDRLLKSAHPLTGTETVPILEANGRILAAPQISKINVPGADNSSMDGYAVRAADCAGGGVTLPVSQRIPAGQVGRPLEPGTAARIFTGAPIPPGADAVVMQEDCVAQGGKVTINHVPAPGEWVRKFDEDIRKGEFILHAGTRLRPQELGLAASVGVSDLTVVRRVRAAIFFTGDELVMPGNPLEPGKIYNSNRYLLTGLLQNLGCDITDFGNVADTLDATRRTMSDAAQEHDLIITSGGVSVGEEDHIRPAMESLGRLKMWNIAIKPGKPLALGEIDRKSKGADGQRSVTPFIGLPGNPVSTFILFALFVKPFILRLQGVQHVVPKVFSLRADFTWNKAGPRNEYLRARMNQRGGLDLFKNQSSGVLTSTVWGDGLIDNPPGSNINPGDMVRFIPFNELIY